MSGGALKDAGLMTYRVFGVVIGGYALWSGVMPLFGLALHALGVSLGDAMLIAAMLGVLIYLVVLIWGFAAPARLRPASVILVLGVASMAAAIHLAPAEAGV